MKTIYVLVPSGGCSEFRVADKRQIDMLIKFRGPKAAESYKPKPLSGFKTYEEALAARTNGGREEGDCGLMGYRYDICEVLIDI
jgi:hypothetical protein